MAALKKTHCKRGHPRTSESVYSNGNCITCKLERQKSNPEMHREAARKWREANPVHARAIGIANNSGLDKETVIKYLLERKTVTVCDICQQECFTGNSLALDHDHETGKIRGLLCQPCNTGLGKFKDSVKLLNRAAEYLVKS